MRLGIGWSTVVNVGFANLKKWIELLRGLWQHASHWRWGFVFWYNLHHNKQIKMYYGTIAKANGPTPPGNSNYFRMFHSTPIHSQGLNKSLKSRKVWMYTGLTLFPSWNPDFKLLWALRSPDTELEANSTDTRARDKFSRVGLVRVLSSALGQIYFSRILLPITHWF